MTEIKQLFEQFIKHKRAEGQSLMTIKSYREHFESLLKFKPDLKLEDLTEKTMVEFYEYRDTRERIRGKEKVVEELKNSSKATIRGKLGAFYAWLEKRKYIEFNPFEKIAYPKVSYTDKRALNTKEIDKIISAVNLKIVWPNLLVKKRNIAMITFLLLTGVRKGELIGLKLSDIDLEERKITVRAETSKSKQTRTIPMTFELAQVLEDYLRERVDYSSEYLWVSNNRDDKFTEHGMKHFVNRLKYDTGINCHLHRFRHTFAINYYKLKNDIVGLKKLLGHKTYKMTVSYLRSLDDQHIEDQMKDFSLAKFV